jgi:hypothetical protein
MGEGFQVFPDDIGASAQRLIGLGRSLGDDIDSLRARTEALTSAFGNDDLGSAIGTIYQVASEAAFDSFHDNADGLGEIGQGLRAMAEHYRQTDQANADSFGHIAGGLA